MVLLCVVPLVRDEVGELQTGRLGAEYLERNLHRAALCVFTTAPTAMQPVAAAATW